MLVVVAELVDHQHQHHQLEVLVEVVLAEKLQDLQQQ
jgi:hypothetical protein